ncbi:MAG: 50S ribosomal protein L11 methyltransferase [Actinomycetota bacterium]|nr:50S ribosomal protein L11 methyltransferase [Actinomycetota bacterium]MDQ6946486.1 50S ribosomal protein L11 methyltransferase [Actinomycetota bacterium]
MLVVVAARATEAASVARQLRVRGATERRHRAVGRGRVLLYGGPFDDGTAVQVAGDLRALGWPSDVRPEGGGHLAAWQAHTRPVVVGGRLWVCFPWSEFDRDVAGDVMEIDPGRAFGTGAHPTTRLLLAELGARLAGGESVLDVGCGSGVLAIAAAHLGAGEVTAVDTSPEALAATRSNAARNQVGERVAVSATPVAQLIARFDVIVANVDAATLVQLAPAIQSCLAPNGWLGLSGLSPAQLSVVAAAYSDVSVVARPCDDDWAALVATRN